MDQVSLNNTHLLFAKDPAASIGKLAAKVAYYNFEWRFVTIVMFHSMKTLGLTTFLRFFEKPLVLKFGRFVPYRRLAVPQLVIFGEHHLDISKSLEWLVKGKYDINAKFLIVCTPTREECDEHNILKTLKKLLIVNVIILKSSLYTTELYSYTYQIVLPGKCINSIPINLNLDTDCVNNVCFKDLYKSKLSNLQECRMRMSTVEQPPFMYLFNGTKEPAGIDGDIMKLVANMLNGTLAFQTPPDSADTGHFENNNWTGSLGDIYNGRAQVAVSASPLTVLKNENFIISFAYYSMDIVWATRLPIQTSSWEKLLQPLNFYLRIALLFMFIGIIFVNTLCKTNIWRKVRRAFKMEPPKYSLCFYSWILFLGLPILREPAKRSYLITVYTWIWFCFLVRCIYQVALIKSLKQPSYLRNIQNFQEVLADGYPFGGPQAFKDYFSEDPEIYNNWQVIPFNETYDTLDDIIDGKTDFVIASNKEVLKHYLMKFKGQKQLQIIPEKIVNSPMVIYYKKYSPLTNPLNYVLRVAMEGGFVQRSFKKYLDHDRILLKRYKSYDPEALNMDHFAGSFLLLFVGMFLSITYFVVELICGNLKDE